MKFENLEEKCRYYQSLTNYKLLPNSYVIVHLDGKGFSKLIKNKFKKPFDNDFINMMNKTAQFLCKNVQGCKLAYVQSDEISLLITDFDTPNTTDLLYGGRLNKIQSILASLATSEFNKQYILYNLSKKVEGDVCFAEIYDTINSMNMCQFDCKAWVVPNENDAFAWFLFRNIDCVKNSKQQTAQNWCSHKELFNKDTDEQIDYLLKKHNIDWNSFDNDKKFGRFVYRIEKHEKKEINGEIIEFLRSQFKVFPLSFMLTEESGKNYFFEILNNSLKK